MTRVLVVDDEPAIRWLIANMLATNGYEVLEAGDGIAAVDALDEVGAEPDLIVLDMLMPGMDGIQVLAEVRRRGDTPVIMLTAMSTESDRISGLDGGADDYLVKPFSIGELHARVRALLRRSAARPSASGLVVDRAALEVRLHGSPVPLTKREFELLAYLADNPGRVVGTAELLERVWRSSTEWQDPSTVKEHVRRLRAKVGPEVIKTSRGAGYLFDPAAVSAPPGAPPASPVGPVSRPPMAAGSGSA
jgi:DNA-binding response OmpR family regulator